MIVKTKTSKRAQNVIKSFTLRERKVFDYLVKIYTQGVKDLHAIRNNENKSQQSANITHRLFQAAYTLQCFNLHIEFEGETISIQTLNE